MRRRSNTRRSVKGKRGENDARPGSLWRNSDYVGWWIGTTLSALGTSVSTIAYPLLALSLTDSVAKAGLIGSANLIGILITALWGGALADRISRRGILITGALLQTILLAGVATLVKTGNAEVPLLIVSALLGGLFSGVVFGAGTPALRRIVSKEQLPTANAQSMARDMAAHLLGAPLGGLLFSIADWLPFALDAVSFGCATLGVLHIRRSLGPDRAASRPRMIRDITDGLTFVWHQPFLRFVVAMASLLNMLDRAFLLLLIALVLHRGGSPTEVGLVSAMVVAGGLVGAPLAPVVTRRFRARPVLSAAVWSFTVGVTVVALVPEVWQIAAVVCVAHLAMAPVNVILQTYVMRLVPDGFLGRVAAVNRFGAYALEWLGPLLAGLLAAWFGVPGGLFALLIVIVPLAAVPLVSRSLRTLNTPVDQVSELTVPDTQPA